MNYYKDPNTDEVYAYDNSQEVKPGLVAITASEAKEIIATQKQAMLDARTYAQKRQSEYPDFREYLDGVVKGDQAQIDKYIADCVAVKAKYPKPEPVVEPEGEA
jgi:hypothetical protein